MRVTVQAGDTLGAIAQRFGTTVEELQLINGILDPDRIFAGQTLELPDPPLGPGTSDGAVLESSQLDMADAPLPFAVKGPGPLIETAPTERVTSDGQFATTFWKYPWFISSVQHYATVPRYAPGSGGSSSTRDPGCAQACGSARYRTASTPGW